MFWFSSNSRAFCGKFGFGPTNLGGNGADTQIPPPRNLTRFGRNQIGGSSAARVDEKDTNLPYYHHHPLNLSPFAPQISLSLPSSPLFELASLTTTSIPLPHLVDIPLLNLLESSNSSSAASAPTIQATSTHWFQLAFGVGSQARSHPPSSTSQHTFPTPPTAQLYHPGIFVASKRREAARYNTLKKSGRRPPRSQAQSNAPSLFVSTLPPSSVTAHVLNVRVVCGTYDCQLGLSRWQANPTLGGSSVEFMNNSKLSALLPLPSPPRRVAAFTIDTIYDPGTASAAGRLTPPSTIQASSSRAVRVRLHRRRRLCRRRAAAQRLEYIDRRPASGTYAYCRQANRALQALTAAPLPSPTSTLSPFSSAAQRRANAALDASSIGFTNRLNLRSSDVDYTTFRPPLIDGHYMNLLPASGPYCKRRLHDVFTSAHRRLLYVSSSGERAVSITLITQHIVVRRATFAPDPFGRLGHRIHDVSKPRERRFCIYS
ncbi:hypothetical protein R3P38DRAFT_3340092 [Favolaschia claudopus]|uniref:Uncharacterized protein n=1 Tax=Favolaschia claudopus TaxID=2862362 RepID=A0AAW0EJJ2_9AGAR